MAVEQSIMNPYDAGDIRKALTHAILVRWPIPSIEFLPGNEDYELSEKFSAFQVNSFGKTYHVRIEEVSK